ncbi:MAG: hypothetical protein J3K34DRAFT_526213, partial [Monoraphidium minutum]
SVLIPLFSSATRSLAPPRLAGCNSTKCERSPAPCLSKPTAPPENQLPQRPHGAAAAPPGARGRARAAAGARGAPPRARRVASDPAPHRALADVSKRAAGGVHPRHALLALGDRRREEGPVNAGCLLLPPRRQKVRPRRALLHLVQEQGRVQRGAAVGGGPPRRRGARGAAGVRQAAVRDRRQERV